MSRTTIAVAVAVVLAGALLWASGALDGLADPERIRAIVRDAGVFGPLAFVAIAMALFAVFLLAPPVWAAAVLWPLPLAFTYSLIAAAAASVITWGAGRWLGREAVRGRIPPRIRGWERRLESYPFTTVVSLRLLLWANPLVDLLLAVSNVPARTYFLGTAVGLLPPTAFHVGIGAGGAELVARLPGGAWAGIAVATVIGGAAVAMLIRRRQRARSGLLP